MKKVLSFFTIVLLFVSCRKEVQNEEMPAVNDEQVEELVYINYGELIDKEGTIYDGIR